MPYFSDSDIDEAKRRVREMQSKTKRYTSHQGEDEIEKENADKTDGKDKSANNFDKNNSAENGESISQNTSIFDLFKNSDSSDIIILALIMVLSREGADNMLIFALLYLLL